jgi:intracellular septation protein
MNPRLKMALDYGPLLIFFLANSFFGILTATAVNMVTITCAIGIEFAITRRVSPMLLFVGTMVLIFGGLTLWLSDATFFKVKITFIYLMLAALLLGGLLRGHLFLKLILGQALRFPDPAWRTLTWRWAIFFVVLAILNEIVWRNFSTNIWVAFKVFGVTSLSVLFALAQTPFIARHQLEDEPAPPSP